MSEMDNEERKRKDWAASKIRMLPGCGPDLNTVPHPTYPWCIHLYLHVEVAPRHPGVPVRALPRDLGHAYRDRDRLDGFTHHSHTPTDTPLDTNIDKIADEAG